MYSSIISWATLIVFAGLTVFIVGAVWNVYQKAELTKENAERIQTRLTELQAREAELEASVSSLQTDFGVESEIRDKYGFIKEGEEVVVIIDDKQAEQNETTSEKKGFWEKLLNIF